MKLYEINDVMRALIDTISDIPLNEHGKAFSAEDQEMHDSAMLSFQDTSERMTDKIRAVIAYSLELDTQIEARAAQIDAIENNVLSKLRKANDRDQKKAVWLRDYASGAIQINALPMPMKFSEFTVALQKNPQSVEIHNSEAIPDEYKTLETVVKVSKKMLGDDLKAGVIIPGAGLSPVSYRMTVK